MAQWYSQVYNVQEIAQKYPFLPVRHILKFGKNNNKKPPEKNPLFFAFKHASLFVFSY